MALKFQINGIIMRANQKTGYFQKSDFWYSLRSTGLPLPPVFDPAGREGLVEVINLCSE